MMPLRCCACWVAALSAYGAPSTADAEASRPNVLFLVADDERPDTIVALGNSVIRTPALDRLAREGTAFARAVCAYPICVSSRAEILTGCTAFRAQVPYADGKLNDRLPRLPEVFKAAGYHTWYVGKWHTTGKPTTRGYEATRGLYGSGGGKFPMTYPTDRLGQPVTGYTGWVFQDDEGHKFPERGVGLTPNISEQFADAAIELVEGMRDERPFFLHVNFTAPHDPRFMPKGYEQAYDPTQMPLPKNFAPQHPFDHGNLNGRDEVLFPRPLTPQRMREELAVYYALVEHLDAQIGRITAALEKTGRLKHTIVVFTSDHGLAVGSHGLTGKQNMYEHTIGVPLVMSGPGVPTNRRIAAQCYLRDLFPTFCELCGVAVPTEIDGRSLKPVLDDVGLQERSDAVHPFVVGYFRDVQRMIRMERWKLIRYPQIDREQLFDLTNDPDELHDLIEEPTKREIADDLRKKLAAWLQDHGDPLAQ